MERPFWNTSKKRLPRRRPRRRLALTAAALLGAILPLGLAGRAEAFPMLGGLIKELGGLFGGLLLALGGNVHDQTREDLQASILAREGVKMALMAGAEEALHAVRGEVTRWDSLRVAWLGEYQRQLTKAPTFDYETAPAQQRRFEDTLAGRDTALLAFMDDRSRVRALWTATDPLLEAAQGNPLAVVRQATESALGSQTGAVSLMEAASRAFEADNDELARIAARIDTLAFSQQMRDVKAQGLLLEVKQLQQVRYHVVTETARRAAAYGERLNQEARRRALYERLLLPARPAQTNR